MKLDNEHVRGVQTPPRKSYNPFESDDEDTDTYVKSSINGYDIKSFETTDDSLTFHLDSSDLSWEEAILRHSRMLSNSMTVDASREEVLYRKDTELFTDKTTTECELPELVFSFNDNGFHSVKDIGIDDGMPTHDKVCIKSQDIRDSNVSSGVATDDDVVKGELSVEGLKSTLGNYVEKDAFSPVRSEDLVKENGLVYDPLDKSHSADQCKTRELVKVDEFEHDTSETEAKSNGKMDPNLGDKEEVLQKAEKTGNNGYEEQYCNGNVPLSHAEESPVKPATEDGVEAHTESNKKQSEELAAVKPVELPASHELPGPESSATNTPSYDSKVESGSIILDFNAAAKVSGKESEDIPQKNKEVAKPPETQTMSRSDGSAGLNVQDCGTDKRVHGETSFSAAMPLPASIAFMGPYVHNGSVSFRSESSTGSTRSFAFPVLQTEWISSPVRMAKADQSQFHKRRGCIYSLICCKF